MRGTCVIDGCGRPVEGRGWCHTHYHRWYRTGDPETPSVRGSLRERLFRRVSIAESGCWEWTGAKSPFGHGVIGRGPRGTGTIQVHRASWQIFRGPIPDGLCVCHHCDNPPCVNPDHLFIGTRDDNNKDMVAKGRHASQKRVAA